MAEDDGGQDRKPIYSIAQDGTLFETKYIRRREGVDVDGNERIYDEEIKFGYPKSYEKWGVDIVKAGYTLLPNHLIGINRYLSEKSKLTPSEMMVLIVVLSNWWDPQKMPAASKKYIGERVNLSPRQVQRVLKSLETKKVLKRWSGGFTTGGASQFSMDNLLRVIRDVVYFEKERATHDVQLVLDFDGQRRPGSEMLSDPY